MKQYNEKNAIKVIGIDLAKNSFQVHSVNQAGHKVMSKKMSRQKLKAFMMNLPPAWLVWKLVVAPITGPVC